MKLIVNKRTGEKEEFDAEKINKVLLWATENINGVSASDVAMNAEIQFFPGITTKQIHEVLINSAVELISEKTPNYQYVAANLLNYLLRKEILGIKTEMPQLFTLVQKNVERGVYDSIILEKYTLEEFSALNLYIKHKRDYELTYAGLEQLKDKYLVQNRTTGEIYETPQYAFMLIAMTVFMDWPSGDTRFKMIKDMYDEISLQRMSLPTPIMAGVRTPNRQYSSCTLIETGDSLDSITQVNTAITKYVAKRAGIGISAGRLRAINSPIRGGEVRHTGVIPFLKQMQSSVHSCSQGGIRKGSATVYFPWWHAEIEDIMVLKNNKGTDDNRVRHMDYGIQFSRLFYQRFKENADVALFSPSVSKDLYEHFGDNEKFDALYLELEANKKIERKTVKARDLMDLFNRERSGTGRLYVMNIDHANSNSAFKEKIRMSNLCVEVTLPTKPLSSIYDIDSDIDTEFKSEGEIALCVLAAFNLGNIKTKEEMMKTAESIIRLLDFVIEHQDYPVNASRKMLKRRSVGVGVTNFAYWMAKNDLLYTDNSPETLSKVDELFDNIQFSLLTASNKLAKEQGACEWFHKTTYADGILPIDRYNKNMDKLFTRTSTNDWEGLRTSIKEHGLRNSVVTAIMPAESSAVVQNATNGIEPIRNIVTSKRSKGGVIKQVAPESTRLKNKYQFAYDMKSNKGYIAKVAVMQKWIDQSISANLYYEYSTEGISMKELIEDQLYSYMLGLKTLYYANTNDKKGEIELEDVSCAGGGCTL